jgi:REP element-mobilizing transposase RayT
MKKPRRRPTLRWKGHDYAAPGYYFVTICTQDHNSYFGEIVDKTMRLNAYGEIAARFWQAIPSHYENVALDEWVIMPDHIHGIIIIDEPGEKRGLINIKNNIDNPVGTDHWSVPTMPIVNHGPGQLSRIIMSFKGAVIKEIHKKHGAHEFAWQRSYYDRAIRSQKGLFNIKKYIKYNPVLRHHPKNTVCNPITLNVRIKK